MARVGLAPGEGLGGMSIQNPLWLIVLAAIPPLVILTVSQLRRRSKLLTSGRAAAFLALRIAAILCLALGLAGMALARFSDRLSIVFLLDQSRSISAEQRERALRVVETIRGRLGRGDTAALVRFGASAQSESLEAGVPVAEEGSDVDPGATNIGAALQDGLAQAGTARRPASSCSRTATRTGAAPTRRRPWPGRWVRASSPCRWGRRRMAWKSRWTRSALPPGSDRPSRTRSPSWCEAARRSPPG